MRQNKLEIDFNSLVFDEKTLPTAMSEYQERSVTLPDGSAWFFREYHDPKLLAQETLCWDWVNLFSPRLILERRTVYKMGDNERTVVGSCWEQYHPGDKKVFQSAPERLNDFDVPLAFSILFFLNQSYSQVNSYRLHGVDYYKIDRFECSKLEDEQVVHPKNILIHDADIRNTELMDFLKLNDRDRFLSSLAANEKFCNLFWLGLLNIALMPNTGWDPIFTAKQIQLRHDLLETDVLKVFDQLSRSELQSRIELFCRQFTECNSGSFFEYRNSIIKNYCLFLTDLFLEKIKKIAEQFVLKLEKSGNDSVLNNMDEHTFHHEVIKSSIGKIYVYLNTQTQLSSESSLDYFVRCSLMLTMLTHYLSLCSLLSSDMFMLSTACQRVLELAVNTKQLESIERHGNEHLKIDLNKFSQPGFAQQCVDWLKRTERNGLNDVLLNKNMLAYVYQRAVAQFKGAQPTSTSYPRFLAAAQPVLPEVMEQWHQKIIAENNSEQLCVHVFELMKIAPPDCWNLFMRQLAVVVFFEDLIVTVCGNIMLPENRHHARLITTDIQQLFATVKVPSEALVELNAHFREVMLAQIKESHDSQSSGFRASGYALFSDSAAAAAAASSSQPNLSSQNQQTVEQFSLLSRLTSSLPWPFK